MYRIEWEFLPAPGREAEFLRAYGADGDWVLLFRRGDGYLGTELLPLPLPGRAGWYRTVDRWESEAAYAAFRAAQADKYAALDLACEALTAAERRVSP